MLGRGDADHHFHRMAESKKHHYVPQWLLRRFAADAAGGFVWVYDKTSDRTYRSSILNAGSQNHFNVIEKDGARWNFEDIFLDVDGRSAALATRIVESGSVEWLTTADREVLFDLFATQMVRTQFWRSTPRHLVGRLREVTRGMGHEPDADPAMAMPDETALRLGAVKAFAERDRFIAPMRRLRPALFAAGADRRLILSDHPVMRANAYAQGEAGLSSHGIMLLLPLTPELAVALVCPTIFARYESIDDPAFTAAQRASMRPYRDGFRAGTPIAIHDVEIERWNSLQTSTSARYLYASAESGFNGVREALDARPELRSVETLVSFGEPGVGPPRRPRMPMGLQLAVYGEADTCVISLEEVDRAGEGVTARTRDLALLGLVAEDAGNVRVELYENGQPTVSLSGVEFESFGHAGSGWFRAVHRDPALRQLALKLGPSLE